MSETKFTPGPWVWSGPDYGYEHEPPESCASYGLNGPNEDDVLSGCGDCSNIFYNEADGRLIAAAPDLYEALEAAQEELRLIRMKDTDAVYNPCLRMQMNLALAKARGEA
jgi:hypothetical protein